MICMIQWPVLLLTFRVLYIYMQYKFIVDGEWRHDEHQPFVSGSYGVMNTVFLPREPDVIPATYSPRTPGRSNMDLDDVFVRSVRASCLL